MTDFARAQMLVKMDVADASTSANQWLMAWAVDITTGQPRYILELDHDHRGQQCNCRCPSCDANLTAVNAAKSAWKKRPHFRHPPGAAREKCLIVAARKAIEAMFVRQRQIVLPRRRRSRDVEGLSGTYFNAWVERPAEAVAIADCSFEDEARAILTLDDGRRLLVQLVGRGEATIVGDRDDGITAQIEIRVDDPVVANMAPEDILSRLELSWEKGCWIQHWDDSVLDADAVSHARAKAFSALDWFDDDNLSESLTPMERRETLLHREVKAILERERRIRVPELHTHAELRYANGHFAERSWSQPSQELSLKSVELEAHLGRAVPDVVATWVAEDGRTHPILIEVTVTNPIGSERIDRLSSFGWPALEIDIGRMGGIVTREEFARLVVDEVAGKRWLYHPTIEEERQRLQLVLKEEETQSLKAEQRRQAILAVPAREWANRFLDAVRRRWQEQLSFGDSVPDTEEWRKVKADISDAIDGLTEHGYFASLLDDYPLRKVIARILSFHDRSGIEYRMDAWGIINAILCDGAEAQKWHTFYLIALKLYPPELSDEHLTKLMAWRDKVIKSVRNEEETYVRDTIYDRLIGLLFPEMRPALQEPFGTPLYIPERERDDDSWRQDLPVTAIVAPVAATERAPSLVKDLDQQLLEASGIAAGKGQTPMSFANSYASQIKWASVQEIVNRLIQMGVAKTNRTWN